MRLIDYDAVMAELEKEYQLQDHEKTAHEMLNVVKYFPTIEPENVRENRRGHWIELKAFNDAGFWKCSACGIPTEAFAAQQIYKFCPFCGADLRGTQNGDE